MSTLVSRHLRRLGSCAPTSNPAAWLLVEIQPAAGLDDRLLISRSCRLQEAKMTLALYSEIDSQIDIRIVVGNDTL